MLVLLLCVAVRVINALTTKTFSQPDEYWQSLEPAHWYYYGYGYLTWEWKHHIRSWIHPSIFILLYKCVDSLNLSETRWLILAPRLLQSVFAACADWATFVFAKRLFGVRPAKFALLASLTNPFAWYTMTRTFSNSMEASFAAFTCAIWPWPSQFDRSYRSIYLTVFLILIATCIRPTAILLWIMPGLLFIAQATTTFGILQTTKVLVVCLVIAIAVIASDAALNYYITKQLMLPIYQFYNFNVSDSLSVFYGASPIHYYISQGIPLLFMGYLPAFLYALIIHRKSALVWTLVFVTATYSLISHKEHRFILSLLPIGNCLIGSAYAKLNNSSIRFWLIAVALTVNLPAAYFFNMVHQRGVIDVSDLVREIKPESVGFLMPCHSTPWQSYFHSPHTDAWFLTCEPPIGYSLEDRSTYRDEADKFYDNTELFVKTQITKSGTNGTHAWPEYLVFFEQMLPLMQQYCNTTLHYEEHRRFFNTYFHDDHRRSGDIIVWRHTI
ncbi:glycosyltransferase family 22 protein [Tortispora caseinolytica NRRL Y-17796]|uniref:Mannosyltransferase n=1 Tax=Tortispora caseinolytica NRRL Y-17796 TaxID=767744 RepID=A0A1E4TFM3_9ASCO|nr:glycosyltransferase family 22 protein [Tortispora caseinolytica NRRL Y-17796]